MVKVLDTKLKDAKIVETDVFGDHRGFFTETYTKNKFEDAGINIEFTQDNQSLSSEPGVLRGLHFQKAPYAQTKLLRAITGVIYDVIVDIRKGSPTYKQWQGFINCSISCTMIYNIWMIFCKILLNCFFVSYI